MILVNDQRVRKHFNIDEKSKLISGNTIFKKIIQHYIYVRFTLSNN